MFRAAVFAASVLLPLAAHAAEPVRIGITTILSGPLADRGQSEQYGAQIALDEINQAGGLLGRPVEAFYADNACKPEIGVPATRRLIEQEHVPVLIGALCTPVTHAIMPLVQQARIPLVIATSAGQDFVEASGVGGNAYAFKTIPSEVDIARGLMRYLRDQKVASVAIVADAGAFQHANAVAMADAAKQGRDRRHSGRDHSARNHRSRWRAEPAARGWPGGPSHGSRALHQPRSSKPTERATGPCQ